MHDTLYWLAVLGAAASATYLFTLIWLDSPTGAQRDDQPSRDRHPSRSRR